MNDVRGTKRRLDVESSTPGPAETLTTEQSFKTAEETTLPAVSGTEEDDDLTEVSSPARPTAVGKKQYKKQVERLHEEAATFAQAKTVFRRKRATSPQKPGGPSQRELRAQLRAQRNEQRKAGGPVSDTDDAGEAEAADIAELEAAASLVDLMAHEALPEPAGDEEDREASQNTGSSADRAFTAAWAKVYGTNGANPAATSRLATDWSTQHSLAQQAQANIQPAVMSLVVASHQQAAETIPAATNQAVVAQQHPAQFALSPAGEDDVEYALAADEPMAEPAGEDDFHDAAANDEPETVQPQAMAAFASPGQTPQQTARPVTVSFPNTRQQQHDVGTSVSTATPLPAAQNNAKQQAGAVQGSPLAARKAAIRASSVSPHSGGLAGLAPPAAPGQKVHKQAATQMPDLDTQAMQLAMQRLAAREAQQKTADEVLLHSCPPHNLVQVPLWAHNLTPGVPHQLQGTLTVPSACSVRLLRRMFARAVQIQPLCVQLSLLDGGPVLQDFVAGQEASIRQYGLEGSAAGKGLEVTLCLQEGSARVQALIQQEVDLVQQELLSTRLRSPAAANAAGTSGQGDRTPAGQAVTAVLQSAGWGTTSPAKRIPKALPSQAAGRQLADYEALLPADQDDFAGAPVVSPGRRRLGRWSQAEVEALIRKMEAAHTWAQIRDEWPILGFPKRSDVDLKDKWRNLEDVVLQGKATRTVKLTQEQKERIHRCHRKYRSMEAAGSPDQIIGPTTDQTSPSDASSPAEKQPEGDSAAEVNPMTTRSKARAHVLGSQEKVQSPTEMHSSRQVQHILSDGTADKNND